MIKAIIVEDKPFIRKGLLAMLEMITAKINVVNECESVKEAVISVKKHKPDLVFLDINLIDGTAFDFIEQTHDLEYKIIFITAYEEYAIKALKTGAIDYILKPIDIDELQNAVDKVIELDIEDQKKQINLTKAVWEGNPNKIILSLQDCYQIIETKELMYCESDKGYTTFYLENKKKYVASKPLKEFEEQLLKSDFVRPHQSFMVNLNFIDKYDKSGEIHLKNGVKIPVSTRKKEYFLTNLFKF